jgi:DNA-binding transcriptional LysR family regulator
MNGGYVMELRDLEYFVVVAEHGQLGRAAELLGLSQPALSKSLRRLEDALEVRLFRRSASGMELTAEGSLLLSRARELQQSLRNVAREVSDVSRGHAGHIRIGVGPIVNDEFLLAAISELLNAEPRISMKVIVSDIDEIMPALHAGQIDVIVNLMVFKPPAGLAYIPLREDECVVCCARNHRLAARAHVPLSELGEERWALGEPGLPTQQKLYEVFRDNGLEPPRVALVSRLLSLRLEAAANSDLLMYTSRAAAVRFGARLQVLPVEELYWVRSAGVLHRKEPYLAPAVRRFIEILTRITSSTGAVPVRFQRATRQSERG